MCGASRESSASPRVRIPLEMPPHAAVPAEPDAKRGLSATMPATSPQSDPPAAPMYSEQTNSEPVWPAAEDPVRPAEDPALFAQFYDRRAEQSEEEEEPDNPRRRFDYRLVAVPVLLIVILALGYLQRGNAKAFYGVLKQMAREQMATLWNDNQNRPASNENVTAATKQSAKVKTAAANRGGKDLDRVKFEFGKQGSAPRTMQIRVEGQPGPEVTSAAVLSPVRATNRVGAGFSGATLTRTPESPMNVEISPRESLSLLIRQVAPSYPAAARAARVQGAVVLKATIRKDGNVGDLKLVSGDPMLVQAAMDSVRQWVYRPYYRNGEPAEVETLIVVEFSLASERAAATNPTGN